MTTDIHDYCRLGIVHSMAFPQAAKSPENYMESLMHLLRDPYFDVVEIGHVPFDSIQQQVVQAIRCAHMELTYSAHGWLFLSGLNINSLDENERRKAVRLLYGAVDEAYAMGASDFQFLSRGWDMEHRPQYLQALVKSTVELCKYAEKQGNMPVCLEIFDHDIDKKSLIGPAYLAKEYVQLVNEQCDNFGLMVDCSHIPMIGETIDEALDPIAPYVVHAHMGNTLISDPSHPSYGDMHPRFGFPQGENDTQYLAQYLRKLLDIGYLDTNTRPILSFEVKPQGDEDPLVVIANAKRTLRDAWRLV